MFGDGHAEAPRRKDLVNPAINHLWRPRWNNDNEPHNEVTWTVDRRREDQPDPR
ncbi:MAG TPA: hypothetical protein PKM43_03800 [Verrucomicrobiota bacterium]|nr:hypothetical protein [Verrucomicrobiota bacterium]HRZ37615.1 hypothetical protein [Candidatus Paceibacterota bacterium]